MIYRFPLFLVFLLIPFLGKSQIYRTQALEDNIHSVQVLVNGDWNSYPIINLKSNENDLIEISFDQLTEESFARLRYKIILCNADWSKNNELIESEYLDGFNDNQITNYTSSLNTSIPYIHYSIGLPNEEVTPKLAGNYVVEVYDEDDIEQKTLLTACFSILEEQVQINPQVSSITNVDSNSEHHQLSFDLSYTMNLRDVKEDLKVLIRQNNRLDNERKWLKPSHIMPAKLRYTNNKDLIFEAGDEYHRFDTSSRRHNGKNVAHIEYQKPYYHMYIVPNRINSHGTYSYDQDQNGRVIYRTTDSEHIASEGDYFYTHFSLRTDEKFPNDIYINGSFTNNNFSDTYKMKYDEENSEYILTLLLKQGIYNYQYLSPTEKGYSPKFLSGNFYETENEYSIYVYYRPVGQKYDSLVGFTYFQSRTK